MKRPFSAMAIMAGLSLFAALPAHAAGINTDAVNELTPDAGVTVDGVAIKDGKAVGTSTALDDADGTLTTKDYVALPRIGNAYVVVETTDTDAGNGTHLLAALDTARGLSPSASNRVAVIVPPARYDMGTGAVLLDTPYMDLIGLTTDRDAQYIYGASNGANTGVLMQTADHVRIENLRVECTWPDLTIAGDASDPAAYYPSSGLANTVVRNCAFVTNESNAWSMRIAITYAGVYEDCFANGEATFGGGPSGVASGTFTHCTGDAGAFGGAGTASGAFINCTGTDSSFGGFGGTASGTFTNCTGGDGAFGGDGGTASGTFTNCTGGNRAFGGDGVASGTFTNCTGDYWAFGGFEGTASGTFTNCTGGREAFGGPTGTADGGVFRHCTGGFEAFTESGLPAPVHLFCIEDNAQYTGNE